MEKLLFQVVKAIIHFSLSKQQPGSSTSGIHVEKFWEDVGEEMKNVIGCELSMKHVGGAPVGNSHFLSDGTADRNPCLPSPGVTMRPRAAVPLPCEEGAIRF